MPGLNYTRANLSDLPDEAIRRIAEAKDVATCRARIAQALEEANLKIVDDIKKPSFRRYSSMIKPYSKSVVLGGGMVLYPMASDKVEEAGELIKIAMQRAEDAAFESGYLTAKGEIRLALGLAS